MLLCVTVVLGAFMEVDEVLKGTVTFSVWGQGKICSLEKSDPL
jgi:hypothetical protein